MDEPAESRRCPRLQSPHVAWLLAGCLLFPRMSAAQTGPYDSAQPRLMGGVVDVSEDFVKPDQVHFVASRVVSFDPSSGEGVLRWDRYERRAHFDFDKVTTTLDRAGSNEFPASEYDRDQALPFEITFVSPRTVRLRFYTRDLPAAARRDTDSLMLAGPVPTDHSWTLHATDSIVTWRSRYGEVRLVGNPWHIEFYDSTGRLLTRTQSPGDPASITSYTPFSFVRRSRDMGRSTAAVFELQHDEKIFGAGESFTRLNKRGQRMVLYLHDAGGAQDRFQYKAIPFFMSSNGYGIFAHTSAPVTFDFGHDFDQHTVVYTGDEVMDLFVFLGSPKDVLSEYTALTGRSPVPPLWSFGLWMSRITYRSEAEVRDVAARLRQYRIPCDVIHIDTGWFETEWRNDYRFSSTRFPDPQGMIRDLGREGFHISLWQYPYFTRKNALFDEIAEKGLAVRDQAGRVAPEDAVLDFSNPATVAWYQAKLKGVLDLGVGAIKADFGEAAPLTGLYRSGRTGWYEHNLYPVRYNKTVWEITKRTTGGGIIWARSAWAGSQRYPLHWGGDAENTNSAMAATLRAGLSFGLSGFTYWSHDIGGFVNRPDEDLYGRWLAFGMLTSHSRTHGAPPREPWTYDSAFVAQFRRTVDLKYELMPYVYAQAKASSAHGWPMLRTLFFEFPDDPTSWLVDDEYMFGSDLLVGPLFDTTDHRRVYLPPGAWIDYQTGKAYAGGGWRDIRVGPIPVVLLVKDHSAIPRIALAQSTSAMDWSHIELRVFSTDDGVVAGAFALPDDTLHTLELRPAAGGYTLTSDPLAGKVTWRVSRADVER